MVSVVLPGASVAATDPLVSDRGAVARERVDPVRGGVLHGDRSSTPPNEPTSGGHGLRPIEGPLEDAAGQEHPARAQPLAYRTLKRR